MWSLSFMFSYFLTLYLYKIRKFKFTSIHCQKWHQVFGNWVRDFCMLDWTRIHKLRSNFFCWVLPPDAKWMKYQTQILQGWMFHRRRVSQGAVPSKGMLWGATMVVAVDWWEPLGWGLVSWAEAKNVVCPSMHVTFLQGWVFLHLM